MLVNFIEFGDIFLLIIWYRFPPFGSTAITLPRTVLSMYVPVKFNLKARPCNIFIIQLILSQLLNPIS